MVMVFTLTANIEGNGVADTVPLEVVGDAGVDAGLLPLHPLQHEALVRHDQTTAHICHQGAALNINENRDRPIFENLYSFLVGDKNIYI